MALQIIRKKGLEFKKAFFAIIAMSMVIIAIGTIMGEWGTKYNSGISYDLDEYNDLPRISGEAEAQKEKLTVQDPDPGTSDFEGKLFLSGYGFVGRIFTPFTGVLNMIKSIERRFGLPPYIMQGVLTFIFISIVTAIVAILFRLVRSNA